MKNLRGQLLISVPEMQDRMFAHSLVLICEHQEDRGAMGFIINRPTELTLRDLMTDMNIKPRVEEGMARPVFMGGPVHTNQGFGLYAGTGDLGLPDCLTVGDELQMTMSRDLLEKCATGQGPKRLLVAIGCAGWEAGQLEQEVQSGAWWKVTASESLLFEVPPVQRWGKALAQLGLDAASLYPGSGHA